MASVPTQVIRVYAMDRLARTQAIGGGIVITTNYPGSGDPVEQRAVGATTL